MQSHEGHPQNNKDKERSIIRVSSMIIVMIVSL